MLKIGYIIFAMFFSVGLLGIFYAENYLRKIISFAVFSNSVIVLFIALAYKQNSVIAIHESTPGDILFADPIPSVLMLTAIVVGISIQAIALALYFSINKQQLQ